MSPHPLAPPLAAFVRLLTGVQVRWLGSEPSIRQRIYFANHTSHLDFVVLWSALAPEVRALTRPVAARDYWQSGFRAFLAQQVFRAVLIDRKPSPGGPSSSARPTPAPSHNPAAVQPAKSSAAMATLTAALGTTGSLIFFPEGTRGSGPGVAPFRSGLFHLARHRPDVELVPVYLENMSRILPKGEFLPIPLLSRLTFGAPLRFDPAESKTLFLARAHAALCALAGEVQV